ncbi:MAG: hypothetical protein GXZ01_11485 [Clostridiaceae bacterium]|nr:hypothetical protein [Clostridiaceae bacterium]
MNIVTIFLTTGVDSAPAYSATVSGFAWQLNLQVLEISCNVKKFLAECSLEMGGKKQGQASRRSKNAAYIFVSYAFF